MGIRLRPVTELDADLLLAWRNDPATRRACRDDHIVGREEHARWLRESLANAKRKIFIAELNGSPVGTVRYDMDGADYELSWTVAPERRGRGVGKSIVGALMAVAGRPVRADIKPDNVASIRIAMAMGLEKETETDGLLRFVLR